MHFRPTNLKRLNYDSNMIGYECRLLKQINRINDLLLAYPPEQINVIEIFFRGAPTTISVRDVFTSCWRTTLF